MSLPSNSDVAECKPQSKPASQKKNRNSKQRKAKNLKDDQNSKIEEIVHLLSQSITKSEPGTIKDKSFAAAINDLIAAECASHPVTTMHQSSNSNNDRNMNVPSPSQYLADMFQNLQINSSIKPAKSKKKKKVKKTINSSTQTDVTAASYKKSEICDKCMVKLSQVPKNKSDSVSIGAQNQCVKNKKNRKTLRKIILNKYTEKSMDLIGINESYDALKKCKKSEIIAYTKRKNNSMISYVVKEQKTAMKKKVPNLTLSDLEQSLKKYQKMKEMLQNEKARHMNSIQNILRVESKALKGNQKVLPNCSPKIPLQSREGNPRCCNGNPVAKSTKTADQETGQNCTAKSMTEFPKYLTGEEMENVGRYSKIYSGAIRINQKNSREAYVSAPDKGSDILILGLLDRNRALEGDEVYYIIKDRETFRINPETNELQRTGLVVALKSSTHSRNAVGTLKLPSDSSAYAVFSPRDLRIPRIRIKKKDWPHGFAENPNIFENKIFLAKILDWKDTRYAEGKIIREIGIVGDVEAETSAIMLMYDLDENEYSDSLKKYMPHIPYIISEEEYSNRLDFRKECIFTIDPATAKDLDDAVSFKLLPSGNYQIGVHISDVTYFLQDGTPLDKAVCNRANSIYLVQKVYHMLPKELCELCSLKPGEDKLTFSVVWEMTPEPEFTIINKFFTRSVINSCGQFSYDQIQSILDDTNSLSMPKIEGNHSLNDVKNSVKYLNKVAVHLRKMRFNNGALKIDQAKIIFSLDEFSLPLDYSVYVNMRSHQLIEELMLLANISVAEKISLRFPKTAFLRSHSPPTPCIMKKIQHTLEKYGIPVDTSSSKSISSFLLQHTGSDPESVARLMVFNALFARPMSRAKYYCVDKYPSYEERRHYALNVPMYTHFTSPIRRYADIIVHRLLAASLGYRNKPKLTIEKMQKIADICNKQKYASKMASDKSTELYLAIYTMQKGPFFCNAVVSDVKDRSLDCIVLINGCHYRIYYQDIKAKINLKNDNGIYKATIIWPRTDSEKEYMQKIEIFTIIKVELNISKVLKVKASLLKGY